MRIRQPPGTEIICAVTQLLHLVWCMFTVSPNSLNRLSVLFFNLSLVWPSTCTHILQCVWVTNVKYITNNNFKWFHAGIKNTVFDRLSKNSHRKNQHILQIIEITRFNGFASIYWVSEVQDWLNIPVVYIAGLDWQQASIQNYGGALEASMERFNKLKLREPQDTEKSIGNFLEYRRSLCVEAKCQLVLWVKAATIWILKTNWTFCTKISNYTVVRSFVL